MNATPRKIGRATVAIGLVAAGTALLLDNLLEAGPRFAGMLLRFWPLLLIGFGIEYLISALLESAGQRRPARFDAGGAFLLVGALALTSLFYNLSSLRPEVQLPSAEAGRQTQVRTISAAGIANLVVEVDLGQVILTPHEEDVVRVEAEQSIGGLVFPREGGAGPVLDVKAEGGGTLRVTGRGHQGFSVGFAQTTYRIHAPADLAVAVRAKVGSITVREYQGQLDLATSAGPITVTDGSGSLTAEADSGSIQVERFQGPVIASTSTGAIATRAVEGTLTLRSGTGVITVMEHTGPGLTAETRTGSINAEAAEPVSGPIVMRTAAGSINLRVPAESDITVQATTRSGGITGMGPGSGQGPSRSATRTLGAGTHQVTLEANMGTINFGTR